MYNSYLKEDTGMSFVYINDLIEGTLKLIETDPAQLSDVNIIIYIFFRCNDFIEIIKIYKHNTFIPHVSPSYIHTII